MGGFLPREFILARWGRLDGSGPERIEGAEATPIMFEISPSRCTECQICMHICAWEHYGQHNPKRARIWVEAVWPDEPTISVCLACQARECVGSCPTGPLAWDGWVRLNEALCDACGLCAEACPVMGLRMDPRTRTPLVCDTCRGAFQCVQWCPTRAIERMGI